LMIDPTVAAHWPVVMTDLPVALLSAISIVLATRAFRDWMWADLVACSASFVADPAPLARVPRCAENGLRAANQEYVGHRAHLSSASAPWRRGSPPRLRSTVRDGVLAALSRTMEHCRWLPCRRGPDSGLVCKHHAHDRILGNVAGQFRQGGLLLGQKS
jgi:hypothetical protein